jgi:hypothetical protein
MTTPERIPASQPRIATRLCEVTCGLNSLQGGTGRYSALSRKCKWSINFSKKITL